MKKVLLAFAVASIFAACDDSKTTDSTTTIDSANVKIDTSVTAPVITDSVKVDTSASKMSADTTKK